jgi:2-iminoacetate synthase
MPLMHLHTDIQLIEEFLGMLRPEASPDMETLAQSARDLTLSHFGRTISLYAPLYLSNHCPGGCAYCGFAADRTQDRTRLDKNELARELDALKATGLEDILLLTGERCPEADFAYLLDCVSIAAARFHNVTVESFAMSTEEYRSLADAGCTGVTLYQETYNRETYEELHRWGPKSDYGHRFEAPARALEAGMRTVGMGVLLGLSNPIDDATALLQHVLTLKRKYWKAGILVSFPRICSEQGGYEPACVVSDELLARMIFAFRIVLPDVPLVLSTRESPSFRDGMAGLGISRMSVASRTSVGGYHSAEKDVARQFDVTDQRDVGEFCDMLHSRGLEPVFKNWDGVFQESGVPPTLH